MSRERTEKLGSLFLAILSTGLAAQLAIDGMAPLQWAGAATAVVGSLSLAAAVRLWPREERVAARE